MSMPDFQPGFQIRPIEEDDLDQTLEVYRQCEDFLALGPVPVASMEMVKADIQLSRELGGIFYGIFESPERQPGRMVGVLDVVYSGYQGRAEHAYLTLLMIAAPYRSKGLGTKVVRWVEGEIGKRGEVRAILAGVQANNPAAIRFWTHRGYAITSGPELMPDKTVAYSLQKVVDL